MGGMLGAGGDKDHGHGFQRHGKVTPDEFKQIVDTLVASKKVYPHEAEEMHRRAADALRD